MSQKTIEPKITTIEKIKAKQLIDITTHQTVKAYYKLLARRFFWGVFGAGIVIGVVLGVGLTRLVG